MRSLKAFIFLCTSSNEFVYGWSSTMIHPRLESTLYCISFLASGSDLRIREVGSADPGRITSKTEIWRCVDSWREQAKWLVGDAQGVEPGVEALFLWSFCSRRASTAPSLRA